MLFLVRILGRHAAHGCYSLEECRFPMEAQLDKMKMRILAEFMDFVPETPPP